MINPHLEFQFTKIEPQSETKDTWKTIYSVPSRLSYFKGHFPKNPILPAVAIIDGALEIIKKIKNGDCLEIESVKKAKFLGLITPGMVLQITLIQTQECHWKCQFYSEKLVAEVDLILRSQIAN